MTKRSTSLRQREIVAPLEPEKGALMYIGKKF